jgi:hypothetical protein
MIDQNEFDDVQAAKMDRRIGQAFAFARVAVADPEIMDIFVDGSDLEIKDIVPNPHIPEHAFIVEGVTATGESAAIAVGVCACNTDRDPDQGTFWLRAGEQWVCPDCRRVYAFDGQRITVTQGEDALIGF